MKYPRLRDFYNVHFFGWALRNIHPGDRVLEIGCGENSLLLRLGYTRRAEVTAVDVYAPYVARHKTAGDYAKIICGDIAAQTFPYRYFDVVVCMDVLEHLSESDGRQLLQQMKFWGRSVIITTPNGFADNEPDDGNLNQKHKSGWSVQDFVSTGYTVRGLSGWKALRTDKAELRSMRPFLFW